ncbi:MAG: hypothetical protein B7Z15_03315 [Rhizobiales bacterium 32-66-8]|nr:MAG: hypothetical protein B7Z15_03315 [Rhizobiales bacterium 32-66-8]
MSALLAAAPLFPFLLALLCTVPAVRRHAPALLVYAPIPGLLAALLVPDGVLVLPQGPFRITLRLDVPGALLLGASAVLWMAAGAYAATYLCRDRCRRSFSVWWLLTLSGSLAVFLVADITSFYLAFALVSLAAYGLAAHEDTGAARRAGLVYLALTLVGEAVLLMAFVLLANGHADANPLIADAVAALPDLAHRDGVLALLILGFGLKMGLFPLHVWMPLAHSVAPVPASAVLSGIVVKAGVIGLIRFLPLDTAFPAWGDLLVAVGIFTAFYGLLVGLVQTRPKTMLAYSTVSQMGVVAAVLGGGLAVGDAGAALAAAFYGANHVLLKGAMFLAVGLVGAGSLKRGAPVLVLTALLCLSLAGLPFTGGALAKYAAKGPLGDGTAAALITLAAAGTTALMLRFLAALRETGAADGAALAPLGLRLPWFILCGVALLAPYGVFALTLDQSLLAALGFSAFVSALWPVLLGAGLALAGLRWGGAMPAGLRIPPGDILVLAERLGAPLRRLGEGIGGLDDVLRRWPVASLLLAGLVVALALAFAGPGRL